ncbi:MAG: hypothetical protein AAB783_02035 [Patescibacteria group bacterium]
MSFLGDMVFIAEVKTQSPFEFRAEKSWGELFEIANQYGDWISIHTDSRWGGSFDLIRKARGQTQKPILAKGIHLKDDDVRMAVEAGADFVLVVGRIPNVYSEKCILEPYTLTELREIPKKFRALWNARDLATGNPKKESFADARAAWSGWLVQASNIKTIGDIQVGADAVLVGEHLEQFIKSMKA